MNFHGEIILECNRMKTLIIFHSLYSLAGGVDNRISELELQLPSELYREYLLFKREVDLPHKGKINYLDSLKIPLRILKNKQSLRYLAYVYGFINLLIRVYKTRKFIKKNNFDTLFAVDDYFSLIAILASIGMKKKIICSVRNNWDQLYNRTMIHLLPDFMYKYILVKLMNSSECTVHCVSKGLALHLSNKYKVQNTLCLYNIFNIAKIEALAKESIDINQKYIINIGHFNSQKNQKDLVLSYSLMRKEGLEHMLVLIGDGLLKDETVKLVNELDLQEYIIFLGKQTNPYKYLSQASLYVSTSLYEGLPAVFVESLILKIPIISYNFKFGATELTEHTVMKSPQALKHKVMEMIDNDKLKKDTINKGNDILKNEFNSEKIINSWTRMLS